MFFITPIIISIIGLLIATYTDLKERIVPNKLNFGLTIIGLTIFLTQTILTQNLWPIFFSIIGMISGFGFAWILWKLGVFAGGDVKLFMALGALNPFTPILVQSELITQSVYPIFPVTLFIHSILAFLPYGLILIVYKLVKNKKERKKVFDEMKIKTFESAKLAFFVAGIYTILSFFSTNIILNLGITIGSIIIFNKFKENKKYLIIAITIIGLIINHAIFLENLLLLIITLVLFYGLIKTVFLIRPLLTKKVLVKDLEEGMIPNQTLVWTNKKIVEKKEFDLNEIIRLAKNPNKEKQKEIVSSIKARGLTIKEIKELQKLSAKKLIPKSILIKDSIPFVPTIFLGYIFCLILGDFIIKIVLLV